MQGEIKMKKERVPGFGRLSLVAVAVATCFAAHAQEIDQDRLEAIAALTTPQGELRLGLGYLSDESRRFGQYSGMREGDAYGLLDVNLVGLDKASGTWTRLYGRNLGLDSREAMFEQQRQGKWRYFLGFSQSSRYEPHVVNTAVSGIGSENVNVPSAPTPGGPADFSLKRDLVSVGFDHAISKTNALRVRFTHETKEGERLYGRGNAGTNGQAIEFLPEPNDRTTETLELAFSHAGKNLQFSGGYYGTLFVNHADSLNLTGGSVPLLTPAGNQPFTPMSQPLSNDSHQLFLTGGYNLTPLTRASFKLSETIARQNENFVSVTPAPVLASAPASLDGRVDTTLAYFDLTSLEFNRFDLQANVRYEDRDDKTPEAQFISAAVPNLQLAGVTGLNKPRSWSSLKTKLEAGYLLPQNFKLLGGWELDQQKREASEQYRKVNFREETDESTVRLELKRSLYDSINGSIALSQAKRTGSDYLPSTYVDVNGALPGTPTSELVNPLIWADRDRTAWKASVDWAPLDSLAVRMVYEIADDQYDDRPLGPRDGSRQFGSIEASYAISDRWQAHFWWSQDDLRAMQRTRTNPALATSQEWQANLRQASESVGAGLQGRMRSGVEIGADVSYSKQTAEQRMQALTGAPVTSLPDYYYRLTEVKLFASFPIDKNSGVRMDYAFYDWQTDDWTWRDWTYRDGTTLTQDATQQTHFVGVSYNYRWK
jgi:MtrB/PioB family decaheme-associated outer membrane protein